MGRVVLKRTNMMQSCSKSRTVSLIYKGRLPRSNHTAAKTVSSTLQAATRCLARLVFSRVGRESRDEWCLTGGGELVPTEHVGEDRPEICVIHVYALQVHVRPSP
jgi:hypothetical protein